MTTIEQAARQALEALEAIIVQVKYYEQSSSLEAMEGIIGRVKYYEQRTSVIVALRQALDQPAEEPVAQPTDEPYGWKVQGVALLFTGEYAEKEAKAAAKRIGGTCEAFPLYVRPQPLAVERERNFCERCGKRLGGADHIHTCTPPQPAPQAAIEQEPVAWRWLYNGKSDGEKCFPMPGPDHDVVERAATCEFPRTVQYLCAFPQPKSPSDDWVPIYTEPPQPEQPPKRGWVGLTEDEIGDALIDLPVLGNGYFLRIARAIESKLKDKNI